MIIDLSLDNSFVENESRATERKHALACKEAWAGLRHEWMNLWDFGQ